MLAKWLNIDRWRRTHRVLAVLFLLSIPPAAYFSFTGDPRAPHPLVYGPLFPLALMTITGTRMLVRPWIKSWRGRPASAPTAKER
jgi:4-amino-4-deoxy-L-arabinose transferase-like glycosyltransferase